MTAWPVPIRSHGDLEPEASHLSSQGCNMWGRNKWQCREQYELLENMSCSKARCLQVQEKFSRNYGDIRISQGDVKFHSVRTAIHHLYIMYMCMQNWEGSCYKKKKSRYLFSKCIVKMFPWTPLSCIRFHLLRHKTRWRTILDSISKYM